MDRRRSKWHIIAGDDDGDQEGLVAQDLQRTTGQQEAQLVRKHVRAARARVTQSKAWGAITGLVDVALFHKSDLLDAPKAAAELAKLLQVPSSRRKGAHLRQLHPFSKHLVLPEDCSKQPHADIVWQLCHQQLQLVQKSAGDTVLEVGSAAKHWVWLLTGDVIIARQQHGRESNTDADINRGILSSSGGGTATRTSMDDITCKGSQVPCFSLLNPGAHQAQPQPFTLRAAASVVQLAVLDVSCYAAAVQKVRSMEQQKLLLKEALLAASNNRTQQQLRLLTGLLHVHPILKHLPEAVRGLAAGMIGYITAPAGTTLYDPGDAMDAWYIILSGKLRVPPHGASAASEQQSGTPSVSISGGKPPGGHRESVVRAGNSSDTSANFSACAAPGNNAVCLLPGAVGPQEQQPLTMADVTNSREKHFESKAICVTDCELAVLGRAEFVAQVSQQQDKLTADRVKLLRGHAVFAQRTTVTAQRVAESCMDVHAAPGALILAHRAAAGIPDAAAGAGGDSTSSSAVPAEQMSPRFTSTDSGQQQQRQRGALIAGQGYAFIAQGECKVVCKVMIDRGKQQEIQPASTASPKAADGARQAAGPTAARPGSPARSPHSGRVAVTVPILQLGPGDVLSTAALAGFAAAEVSVLANTTTQVVWMPESLAQHHLGPQGMSELAEAAAAQAVRLQHLLEDAVAARQAMLQNSKTRPAVRTVGKQVPLQQSPGLAATAPTDGFAASTGAAGRQAIGSIGLEGASSSTAAGSGMLLAARSAELTALLREQQAGALSVGSSPKQQQSYQPIAYTTSQGSDSTGQAAGQQRAVLFGVLPDELDALVQNTVEQFSKTSSTAPGHFAQGAFGSSKLDTSDGKPQAHINDIKTTNQTKSLGDLAGAEDAAVQQPAAEATSRSSSPTAAGSFAPGQGSQPHHEAMSPHAALAPRVRISTAVKQQLLVEPAGSPQLLPHTSGRIDTLLSGLPDPVSGGLDLDPPVSSVSLQDAGFGGYQGFAGVGSLAEQLAQQVPRSPRVVVLPGSSPSANMVGFSAGGMQRKGSAPLSNSSAVSYSSQQHQQVPAGARSPLSAGQVGAKAQSPAGATRRPPRRSKSDISGPSAASNSPAEQGGSAASAGSSKQQLRFASPQLSPTNRANTALGSPVSPNGLRASSPLASAAGGNGGKVAFAGWRRSDADLAKSADPAGPLELDPAAPPLGNMKLSRPDQTDMEYALHRWSERWQSERSRLAAAQQSQSIEQHSQAWARPLDDLSLFGGSAVDSLAQQSNGVGSSAGKRS